MPRRRLRNLPIGRKLFTLSAAITALAILMLGGGSAATDVTNWRAGARDGLETAGKMIGANAAPALLFGDPKAADDTLAALSAQHGLTFAGIYDLKGNLFAAYGSRSDGPARFGRPAPVAGETQFTWRRLSVAQPLSFQGQRLGSIYLSTDLQHLYMDLVRDLAVLLAGCLLTLLAALAAMRWMRKEVVAPIESLTRTVETVSRTSDYAVRAVPVNSDEIGVLAQSFNGMLSAVQERDLKLAQHQAVLEETVRLRTEELRAANENLEKELDRRRAAQEELHAHDAMLKAVTRSAGELLGSLNLDDAIARVMELIGQTLGVGCVHLVQVTIGPDGHLRSTPQQEWSATGVEVLRGHPALRDLDLTAIVPALASAALIGERTALTLSDAPPQLGDVFRSAGFSSLLFVPILVEGRLWGGLAFMDAAPAPRPWSWAETDTLSTLGGLMGVSLARAHYLKELGDANTIVQNSPTVLYRLNGDPNLKLTYISHNVTKFGYDPKALVASQNLLKHIVHPEDQARVSEVLAGMMEHNAAGATIEFRLTLPSGGFRWVENRLNAVRDEVGRLTEIEGIIIDITERKAAEEKIAQLARTDPLTGLANRATFVERLNQAFAALRRGAAPFAVLYLDLDHFKDVNDTRGHPTGDLLLKEVAERLKGSVRETDVVARLGGDEFAVLQIDVEDPADAGALGGVIVDVLGRPYLIEGAELHVTASVGIAPVTPSASTPDVMLSQADLALYRAKEDGRNQYRFHSDDLDQLVSARVNLARDLRRAIPKGELFLDYQPQVELQSGRIVGMEALVRWRHPTRGLLKPADFLPAAESAGFMDKLGAWVLEQACAQMAAWKAARIAPPVMAVNVSMIQLKSGAEFVSLVAQTLKRHGLKPQELEIDVTESMLAKVTLAQNDVLDRLADAGVQLALDDFGQEYSTFDYLRAYRVAHLKVAQQFIENATHDAMRAATVRAIIRAARELGIKVIAEGVENDAQRKVILSIGRGAKAQGFFFSEPVDPKHAAELLKKGEIAPPPSKVAEETH